MRVRQPDNQEEDPDILSGGGGETSDADGNILRVSRVTIINFASE